MACAAEEDGAAADGAGGQGGEAASGGAGWGVRDIWYARCERNTQPLSIVFSVNCLYSSDQYTHRGQ